MQAVIFDMDGVLIDTEDHHKVIEHQIIRELGINMKEEERKPYIGMAADEMWALIVQDYDLDQSPKDLLDLNNERILEYFSKLNNFAPIPGVTSILEWLQNNQIPIAVASSSSLVVIQGLLEQTNLLSYFKIKVGGQSVENSKPEPIIYLHTAENLRVQPENCLVIEDSTNGITAAKAAGMYCIGYRGIGYHGQDQSRADALITDYSELLPIMKKWFDPADI